MKQTCVLILGMHRSGTSALSGVLNILDVYLGSDLMKPHKDINPKGFYENARLYKINEQLLGKIGSSWDDIFYNEDKLSCIDSVKELEQVLKDEFQYSQLFAIKDPRLTYLFPLYAKALANLGVEIKVVIPFRNPLEVAASLKARNNFSQGKSFLLWAYHFLLSEKISRGFPRVFTRFDELVQSPKKVIELIDQKLGLDLTPRYETRKDQTREFLTPDLKHHNIPLDNLSENVPEVIREIVSQIPHLDEVDLTEQLDSLRNQLFGNQALFYNADIINALDELAQAKQGLEARDHELLQAKQGLEARDHELLHAKQGLEAKDHELLQAKQGLEAKDHELLQAKQKLEARDQSLEQAKLVLRAKENEQAQAEQRLHENIQELDSLKCELIGLYKSRSWIITRPLRKIKRKLSK